jgi:transcriptional regulator with XRE-family HTH domain
MPKKPRCSECGQALPTTSLLAIELAQRRTHAGLSQADLSAHTDWSVSKISRIEQGIIVPSTVDVRAMLALYGVTDAEVVQRLEDAAREERKKMTAP